MATRLRVFAFLCPTCGAALDNVTDTRHVGKVVRRRRNCREGHFVTTTETVDEGGILPSSKD